MFLAEKLGTGRTFCPIRLPEREASLLLTSSCVLVLVLARSRWRGCLAQPDHFHMKDFSVEAVCLDPRDSTPCVLG